MEEVSTTPVSTPAPAPAPAPVAQPATETASSGSSDVFESMTEKPLDFKSLLLIALLAGFSIYGIVYYKKAIQKLNEDSKPSDEYSNLVDDLEEVKYNVKKALGKNYKAK